MIKNIIFDWSGVIKDALENHLWVVNRMFEKLGGEKLSLSEITESWEQPFMKFYNKYFPELTLEEQKVLYKEAITSKDGPKPRVYPGIVDLIKKLKEKRIPMVVLSSDMPDTFYPEMKDFGLENIFDDVFINTHDKGEVIGELLKRNNFKPEETVLIGDTNHELEIAKAVGTKVIAVTWGFCTEDKLKSISPDYLVHNVKELEEILL